MIVGDPDDMMFDVFPSRLVIHRGRVFMAGNWASPISLPLPDNKTKDYYFKRRKITTSFRGIFI
jgi:hypothetical protein